MTGILRRTFVAHRQPTRLFGIQAPCFDGEGDPSGGGDGGEWPNDPSFRSAQGDPPAPPPAAPAARPSGTPGAPPPAPAGQPPAAGAPPADEQIPRYRLDEVTNRLTTIENQHRAAAAENQRLRQALATAMGHEIPPAQAQPDERTTRLRAALLQVFPELEQLPNVLRSMTTSDTNRQADLDRGADRTIQSALNFIAKEVLGEGKQGKDLSPFQQTMWKGAFIDWIAGDKDRAVAYEAGEPPDFGAFLRDYDQHMVAVRARRAAAGLESRASLVAGLPQGGPSAAPVASPPADLDYNDVDAVHKRGWQQASAGR